MASDALVEADHRDGVTTLILNRPGKRNALSAELVESLLSGIENVPADTRLLVLQGRGKGFCAGFDFGDIEKSEDADLVLRFIRIELLLQRINSAPYMTLGLAHGSCFGAGADLLAACNHRIAAPGTRFRMPGLQFGIVLGTRRLAALVGTSAAMELLETSKVFDSDHAASIGFVQSIASEDEWQRIVSEASAAARELPVYSQRALYEQISSAENEKDLSALVRSVARPGLKQQIQKFIEKNSR